MKVLYLDCISGISGDMTVGALCDLGVKPSTLEWELSKLSIGDFHMHFDRAKRKEIEGVKFNIHEGTTHTHDQDEGHARDHGQHHDHDHDHDHESHAPDEAHSHEGCGDHPAHEHEHGHSHSHAHEHEHGEHCHHGEHHHHEHAHRGHREIREMISSSDLSDFVKQRSLAIFRRIAEAEGKIHGMSPDDVHFHEVGGLDSIADIVLTCAGIEALKVEKVFASKLHDGHGTLQCAHGTFPVPAPATLEILRGIPIGQIDEPHELITPTGAAILAEFSTSFGLMPQIAVEKIGYGCGSRDLATRPNVLRAVLGTLTAD